MPASRYFGKHRNFAEFPKQKQTYRHKRPCNMRTMLNGLTVSLVKSENSVGHRTKRKRYVSKNILFKQRQLKCCAMSISTQLKSSATFAIAAKISYVATILQKIKKPCNYYEYVLHYQYCARLLVNGGKSILDSRIPFQERYPWGERYPGFRH